MKDGWPVRLSANQEGNVAGQDNHDLFRGALSVSRGLSKGTTRAGNRTRPAMRISRMRKLPLGR